MRWVSAICMVAVSGWLGMANAVASSVGGKLAVAQGDVWVQPPNGAEQAATRGQVLAPGSAVRTGSAGKAEIRFDDGSIIQLRAESKMRLSGQKRQKSKNSVVLFFGRVWSKVTRAVGAGTHYEVKTPNAVCGVRGTEFETAVGDDGSVRVRVSSGEVGVADGAKEEGVGAGHEVEADEDGVDAAEAAAEKPQWQRWQKKKTERLKKNGSSIVDKIKGRIMSRKDRLETLRAKQEELVKRRKSLVARAQSGDDDAAEEAQEVGAQLAEIADAIADIGDEVDSQFGAVDHFADLASDPRFGMVNRKYLEAEAANLRRVKKTLDALVAEGTDISIEAMDQMIRDMGSGKKSTLKEGPGSAMDDLFGPGDEMDMK